MPRLLAIVHRGILPAALVVALLGIVGCDPTVPPNLDGAVPDGEVPDGFSPDGDLPDASVADGEVATDDMALPVADGGDGSVGADDGSVADSSAEDGPSCSGPCFTDNMCLQGFCNAGVCDARVVPDGTPCTFGVCTAGACAAATGCGDGVLGLTEGCDDGNRIDGDACSAACTPLILAMPATSARARGYPTESAPAIAEDETGTMLFVWTRTDASALEIVARRFTTEGVAIDAVPMVVASGLSAGASVDPVVAALPAGFAIVWSAPPAGPSLGGIVVRKVFADGTLGAERTVQSAPFAIVREPRIAALSGGAVVIVWTQTNVDAPGGGGEPFDAVRGRVLLSTDVLQPRSTDLAVSSVRDLADDFEPSVAVTEGATGGDVFVVAWTHQAVAGSVPGGADGGPEAAPEPRVRVRAFPYPFASPYIAPPAEVDAAPASSYAPSLAASTAPGDGAVWLAWSEWVDAVEVDVRVRSLPLSALSYDAASTVTITAGALRGERPAIAAAAGGYVVSWNAPGLTDGGGIAVSSALGVRTPLDALSAQLTAFRVGRIGVSPVASTTASAPGGAGAWVTWEAEASRLGEVGTTVAAAYRVRVEAL